MFYIGLYRENMKILSETNNIYFFNLYYKTEFYEALSVRAVGSTSVSYI